MLDGKMKDLLLRQRLGYVATVSPDGSPNVSPKGTIHVWDKTRLVFANIKSPRTVNNIRADPRVEINVIDPISRRGYRFGGTAQILDPGAGLHGRILSFYRDLGVRSRILDIILVSVGSVDEVTSPLYDLGIPEEDIRQTWKKRILSQD